MPTELTAKKIAEKRNALVQYAIDILKDQGTEALTLRHLAEVSNVSRSTPYLYFKDKAALIDAVRVHSLRQLSRLCERTISDQHKHTEQMRLLADTLITFALKHPELYQLIFVTGLKEDGMSDEFCQAINRYKNITEAPMQAAYQDGNISLPPSRLNPVIWAAIHGMLMLKSAGLAGNEKAFSQLKFDLKNTLAEGFIVKNTHSSDDGTS